MSEFPPVSWSEFFLRHVYLAASKSKDRKTKIGAVLVQDNVIVSSGYNGFPRKVNDDIEERHLRPTKYFFSAHAERNAIYNAARNGIKTLGCEVYTNVMPCSDCAIAIIQSGAKKLLIHQQANQILQEKASSINGQKWLDSLDYSNVMLKEAGVELLFLDFNLNTQCMIDGKVVIV